MGGSLSVVVFIYELIQDSCTTMKAYCLSSYVFSPLQCLQFDSFQPEARSNSKQTNKLINLDTHCQIAMQNAVKLSQ